MPTRDNGLEAAAYTPLTELDPRVADAMLELLRASGIAAYVAPAGRDKSGQFGSHPPQRPADRLYVDADATESARQIVQTHLLTMDAGRDGGGDPGQDPRDEDEIWQALIASYHAEPTDPVPPWPASEDLDEEDGARDAGDDTDPARKHRGPDRGHGDDRPVRSGLVAGDDLEDGENAGGSAGADDEHFVPPAPPPVPRPDPVSAWSWAGLFGGPSYMLIATLVGWPIPGWAAFLAVAAFIGGFVALVVRMGDKPPPDSGPDDGAVV